MFQLGAQGMAESASKRRSVRKRAPSLKAELNENYLVKVTVTPVKTPGRKRNKERAKESEELEDECVATKSRKREQREESTPTVVEVKGQKTEEKVESEIELCEDQTEVESGRGLPTDGYWSHFKSLCSELPGREKQVEWLITLLGKEKSYLPQSVYLYGNSGTGKTYTMQRLVETLELPCAFVNCQECYCSRLLYEAVLNRLKGISKQSTSSFANFVRCDNMPTFIHELTQLIDSKHQWKERTVFIVLDHAERLREMEPTVLPAMLRLSELSGSRVCVVMISEIVFEKMTSDLCSCDPLPVHFPDYSKAETLVIMEMDLKAFGPRPRPFCQTYVHHIWNVFQNVCRDLSELRHLCTLLFPKYCEPVDKGEIGDLEVRKLWRHIQPLFRGLMSRVFLREVSSAQFEQVKAGAGHASLGGVVSTLELPYHSKYLLMAAYIASYNPAKTDKRFFSKSWQPAPEANKRRMLKEIFVRIVHNFRYLSHQEQKQPKLRKSHHPAREKEKPNWHKLGPKPFPLDRLMAIFYSILEDRMPPSIHIYSQVSTLVTLQLLSQQNSRDGLDSAKYKCLVTFEFIRQVAKSINFDIVLYLQDFS